MNEDFFDSRVPSDDLGFSKYVISKSIENSPNVTELRIFGVFGKYEDYEIRFISNAICRTLFGMPISIKQNRIFNYMYIDDLMSVIDYFIENDGKHRTYNVTDGIPMELLTIAKMILEISGKTQDITIKYDGMGDEYSGDNSRLCEEIRGIKFTEIGQAIKNMFRWYEGNKDMIDKNLLISDEIRW